MMPVDRPSTTSARLPRENPAAVAMTHQGNNVQFTGDCGRTSQAMVTWKPEQRR